MLNNKKVLSISGYSGSGKTTLLKKIIPLLSKQGLKVGILKHAHHDIEIDIPGKDSHELRKAGAVQTMLACDNRYAIINETPNIAMDLPALIEQFTHVDLVLIEGFKDEKIAKISCHRSKNGKPLFIDPFTIAVVSDEMLDIDLPLFDFNDINRIVTFITHHLFK